MPRCHLGRHLGKCDTVDIDFHIIELIELYVSQFIILDTSFGFIYNSRTEIH